jgi:hypothetical protein
MDGYDEFVDEATTGHFDRPTDGGWSAEQIVAHVACTNEALIAATEALLAGETISYDDREATDSAVLDAYVASYGGLRGLADRVAQTVAVLRDLSGRLGDRGDTSVPARLQDGDVVTLDQPLPWARLLKINAEQRAPGHLDRLRALRRS